MTLEKSARITVQGKGSTAAWSGIRPGKPVWVHTRAPGRKGGRQAVWVEVAPEAPHIEAAYECLIHAGSPTATAGFLKTQAPAKLAALQSLWESNRKWSQLQQMMEDCARADSAAEVNGFVGWLGGTGYASLKAAGLGAAVSYGRMIALKTLLARGVPIGARDAGGASMLHLASDVNVVTFLLGKGAKAGWVDGKGRTPLHAAAESLRAQVVSLLLAKGANPRATDKAGKTPLDLARAASDAGGQAAAKQKVLDALTRAMGSG